MTVTPQQLTQAIQKIEEQLTIIKQALAESSAVVDNSIIGVFDGEFMVEEGGKRHQVPPNYASKSMLVPGDTIKMVEDLNGGQTKYKQIGKAERAKSTGVLVKKDGKYEVLTEEGSFKVLSASIKHYNGEVGDTVTIQFPKQHPKGSWAAVEKLINSNQPTADMSGIQPLLNPVADTGSESSPVFTPEAMTPQAPTPQIEKPVISPEKPRQGAPDSEFEKPARVSPSRNSKSTKPPLRGATSQNRNSPRTPQATASQYNRPQTPPVTQQPPRVEPGPLPTEQAVKPAPAFDDDDLL